MCARVSIELYHHGCFTANTFKGNAGYVGGTVSIIDDIDPDMITIFDLNEYAAKFDYSSTDLLYFPCDGHSFKKGIRLLYDDDSIRSMISASLHYKRIKIYVDHQ